MIKLNKFYILLVSLNLLIHHNTLAIDNDTIDLKKVFSTENLTVQKLKELLEVKNSNWKTFKRMTFDTIILSQFRADDRMLDFNIRQILIDLTVKKRRLSLDLTILAINDTIFCIKLYDIKEDELFTKIDSLKLKSYLLKHENFYQTNIDLNDKIMSPYHKYIFSSSCGLKQARPELNGIREKIFEKKEYKIMVVWLKSMNPEVQAYGYEGLKSLLENKLIKLTEFELKLMDYVKNTEIILFSCNGCERIKISRKLLLED